MTVWTAHPTLRNVRYAGPAVVNAGADHPIMSLNYFQPTTPNGRLVLMPSYSGLRFTSLPVSLDDAGEPFERMGANFLAEGYGVIICSLPVARGWFYTLPTVSVTIRFTQAMAETDVTMTIAPNGLTGGGTYIITKTQAGGPGQDCIYTITVSGTVSGGPYRLSVNGQSTPGSGAGSLSFNADPDAIRDALEALSTVGTGNVFVSVQAPYDKLTGNPVNDSVFEVDFPSDQTDGIPRYGAAYEGNGMLVLDANGSFTLPAGFSGSIHPMRDPTRLNFATAITMVLQHIVLNAEAYGANTADPKWLGAYGGSGAAIALSWVLGAPERSTYHFPGGTGQDAVTTFGRITWAALWRWQNMADAWPTTTPISSFPKSPSNGGSANLDQNAETLAVTYPGFLTRWGALHWSGEDATALALLRTIPFHLAAKDTSLQTSPFGITNTQKLAVIHDVWFCAAFRKLVDPDGSSGTRLLVGDNVPSTWTDAAAADGVLIDGTYPSAETSTETTIRADLFAWLASTLPAPLSVEPIEEQVLQAVEATLREITVANGYRTGVLRVFRWEQHRSEIREYPVIMVTALGASYDDGSFWPKTQGSLALGLSLVLKGWDDKTLRTSRFIADVRKALRSKFLADKFGQLAFNLHITGSERFTEELNKTPLCGATLAVEVVYRNQLEDPYAT